MTILVPLTADAYDRYLATAITSYPQDNIDDHPCCKLATIKTGLRAGVKTVRYHQTQVITIKLRSSRKPREIAA